MRFTAVEVIAVVIASSTSRLLLLVVTSISAWVASVALPIAEVATLEKFSGMVTAAT